MDAEEGCQHLYREELEDQGYVVSSTLNAKEGLTILQHSLPDLIVSCIQLPGMNGLVFCKVCKEKYPHVPFLICSAYNGYKQESKWGFDSYVVKSANIDELKDAIKKLLFPVKNS